MELKEKKGILKAGFSEYEDRKSRFLGEAYPVHSLEEVEAIYASVCKKYWDASHHIYAYRIGEMPMQEKATDDGEPMHTAGIPVLSILQKEDLRDVLVIVTRYFGGTLLGTGGLVRAYSSAAQLALKDAGIISQKVYVPFALSVDYSLYGKVEYLLATRHWTVLESTFEAAVQLKVLIPQNEQQAFRKEIEEISSGSLVPQASAPVLAAEIDGNLRILTNNT